jgi:hypothetical protein
LYAVWNDALATGHSTQDDALIEAFYAWDPHKKDFIRENLVKTLEWMRKNQLVPTGKGKRSNPVKNGNL